MHIHTAESFDSYVIRTVPLAAIDALVVNDGLIDPPDRREYKAALRFDGPIAATEVLLGPPGIDGRYRVLAGAAGLERARETGSAVVVAAVAQSMDATPRVMRRWWVHHAA
jgi:hypothetical protein